MRLDHDGLVLNMARAPDCARVAAALRLEHPEVPLYAVAHDWTPEDHELVLRAGVSAIQCEHGHPGRHLGIFFRPGL